MMPKRISCFLLSLLYCISGGFAKDANYPYVCLVATKNCMYGVYMEGTDGSVIESYLGVPYAQPPLGALRFRDPIELNSNGDLTLLAMTERPPCVQWRFRYENQQYGEEDCLYLNIFKAKDVHSRDKLPVLVEIADRDFESGDASATWMGPEFIFGVTKGIILVTVASRLSIFGYLRFSFPEQEITGNMGLKDQQLALNWIWTNIDKFGGDRSRVTIAGEAAVSYHLVNRESRELFKNAIVRHTNFYSPHNRPWENPQFNPNSTHLYQQDQIVASSIIQNPTDFSRFVQTPYYILMLRIYSFDNLLFRAIAPFRFKPVCDYQWAGSNSFLKEHPITTWTNPLLTFTGKLFLMFVSAPSIDLLSYNLMDSYQVYNDDRQTKGDVTAKLHTLIQARFLVTEWDTYLKQDRIFRYYFPNQDFKSIEFYDNNMKEYLSMLDYGLYYYPMVKLLQERDAVTNNQDDIILRFNNQRYDYRSFRSTYVDMIDFKSKIINLIDSDKYTARGDENLFLYYNTYYFSAPHDYIQKAVNPTAKLTSNFVLGYNVLADYSSNSKIECKIGSNLQLLDLSSCDIIDWYLHCDPSRMEPMSCVESYQKLAEKDNILRDPYQYWDPFFQDVTGLKKFRYTSPLGRRHKTMSYLERKNHSHYTKSVF